MTKELDLPLKVKKLRYLVVGTGRSGTVYLAKLLSSINIPCSHEGIFDYRGIESALLKIHGDEAVQVSEISKMASIKDENEGINWFYGNYELEADSSYMAAPFLDYPILNDVNIIHVVREPLKVISSFVEGLGYFTDKSFIDEYHAKYMNFICSFLPELKKYKNPFDRATYYYINWNKMIERKAPSRFIYRLGITPVSKLFKFLNVNPFRYYDKIINSKSEKIVDYEQILDLELRRQLKLMTKQYFDYVKI